MQSTPSQGTSTRIIEQFFAFVGAIICLIVSVRVLQVVGEQQAMWPLPGLYLLEMLVASGLAVFAVLGDEAKQSRLRPVLIWVAVGMLLAFTIMGAWSIGFLFAPVASLFALAPSCRTQARREYLLHLAWDCSRRLPRWL